MEKEDLAARHDLAAVDDQISQQAVLGERQPIGLPLCSTAPVRRRSRCRQRAGPRGVDVDPPKDPAYAADKPLTLTGRIRTASPPASRASILASRSARATRTRSGCRCPDSASAGTARRRRRARAQRRARQDRVAEAERMSLRRCARDENLQAVANVARRRPRECSSSSGRAREGYPGRQGRS